MKIKTNLLILSFFIPLTGCVTPYVLPDANQATAEVTFDPGSAIFFNMFINGENCSGKRIIPAESNPYAIDPKPLPILANKEIAFHYAFVGDYKFLPGYIQSTACDVMMSFMPEVNGKYKFIFDTEDNSCIAAVLRLNVNGEYEPEPTARQRNRIIPLLESDPFCDET